MILCETTIIFAGFLLALFESHRDEIRSDFVKTRVEVVELGKKITNFA